MNDLANSLIELPQIFSTWVNRIIEFSPNLIGAALLLIFGWLVALGFKKLSVRLATIVNKFLIRAFPKAGFRFPQVFIKLLSQVVFWITLLFFVTAATQIFGLTAFSIWLDHLVEFFPSLVAGTLIIVVGILLSTLARDLTISASAAADLGYSRILGGLIQGTILIIAAIMGLDQIGVEVEFLVTLLAILVAAAVGSLALGLGLGTQDLVNNLIGGHYLKQYYQPGQRVRLGSMEGTILELTPVAVILSTDDGRVLVPAKVFQSESSILIVEN